MLEAHVCCEGFFPNALNEVLRDASDESPVIGLGVALPTDRMKPHTPLRLVVNPMVANGHSSLLPSKLLLFFGFREICTARDPSYAKVLKPLLVYLGLNLLPEVGVVFLEAPNTISVEDVGN